MTTPEPEFLYRPLGTRQFVDVDANRVCLVLTTPVGPTLTIPLQALYDIAAVANTLHDDNTAEVLRWTWRDPADAAGGIGVVRRAARLVVEEIPVMVPVRRKLEDGSWGTVEISAEEWARNEGRVTVNP